MDDPWAEAGRARGPGAVLVGGRYLLGGMLGQGGMATVFRAHDEVLDRPVAVKVFGVDPAWGADPRRERREVRLLAGLTHPGLVVVHDAGHDTTSAGQPRSFLVMELMAGPSLAQVLHDGPLPSPVTAHLGVQVAGALGYVHDRGLVHRDVKPGNVLLSGDPAGRGPVAAKLADFGIARMLDATRLTMTGTTLGTAAYLSPEQVAGGPVGPPCDVYAFGLVLLECLSGAVAYPGGGVEAAVARLHRAPQIPTGLGPAWTALLTAMTQADPSARPSADHVATALTPLTAARVQPQPSQTPAITTALPATGSTQAPSTSTREPGSPLTVGTGTQARTLPTAPSAGGRRTLGRARFLGAAALVLVLALVAAALAVLLNTGPDPTPGGQPAPAYPSVGGRLGTDLNDLQRSVQP